MSQTERSSIEQAYYLLILIMIKQILFFSVLRKWEFHKIENCNLITHKSSDLRFTKKVSRVEIL